MLVWDWNTAFLDIEEYVKQIGKFSDFLQGDMGEESDLSLDRLMTDYEPGTFFVSKYVVRLVLHKRSQSSMRLAYGHAAALND